MKISKETTKQILGISACIILMLTIALNFAGVLVAVKLVFSVLEPILIGICLAFILNIIVNVFETRVFAFMLHGKKTHPRLNHTLSFICTLIMFFGVIALLLLVIIPQITNTVNMITQGFPDFAKRTMTFIEKQLTSFDITPDKVSEILKNSDQLFDQIGEFVQNNMTDVIQSVSDFGSSIVSTVLNIMLGFFLAMYFLIQRDMIFRQCRRFFCAILKPRTYNAVTKIFRLSTEAFENFISGQFLEAVILGTLCLIGMLILRIPYAPVVSVIVGVSALIPILGAWIGGAISAMLILITDPMKALIFLVFIIVLQQIEGNLIYPRVVGQQVGLPGVWVLLAVILGNGFFGAAGALVAVPVASVFYTLASEFTAFVEKSRREKAESKK